MAMQRQSNTSSFENCEPLDSQPLADLLVRYQNVRALSLSLAKNLSEADACLQSMDDVSPAKWHLAHTSWFFETFILCRFFDGYQRYQPEYNYLFNSYYNGIGEQYPRSKRGLISRPSLVDVIDYRQHIDDCILQLPSLSDNDDIAYLIELGLQHEQQHQELLLTDIKYNFYQHPSYPHYLSESVRAADVSQTLTSVVLPLSWCEFSAGIYEVGYSGEQFAYDNEKPAHNTYIHDFAIASRVVTNGEYIEFINSGAYENPDVWLSDGWAYIQQHQQAMPLYWQQKDGQWYHFTLAGLRPIVLNEPVTHVHYYEAQAYAAWCGKRLPTEMEWEVAAATVPLTGNLLDLQQLHPLPGTVDSASPRGHPALIQMIGDVWEWTSSSYSPYPGFKPFAGVAGEYNGKFMCNQYVLRGGSCATPRDHIRRTYRNFFYAHQAWQFTGIRLAEDR